MIESQGQLLLNKDTVRLFSDEDVWECGGWSVGGCPADITGPVLWSQVHLWPQVLCEQYSPCAKHTQTLPPDTDGKLCTQRCSHCTTTQGLSRITAKNCYNWLWKRCRKESICEREEVEDFWILQLEQTVYLTSKCHTFLPVLSYNPAHCWREGTHDSATYTPSDPYRSFSVKTWREAHRFKTPYKNVFLFQ